jgi:NhaP-type Na+/H+ or K+/H+ antiporter
MEGVGIALGAIAVYALVAGRLDRWSITAPIVLVATGAVLGQGAVDVLHVTANAESIKVLAELTLAVLLFVDASTIQLRNAGTDLSIPGRLLGIGLPLTMALGALVARVVLGVSWAEAALVAAILAPTDAALGLAVVTNRAVPTRIRHALNIESGLNDGIVTPFVVFFLAVVVAEDEHRHWVLGGLKELALAAAFGVAIGVVMGAAAAWARRAGWTTHLSEALVVLSVALLAYEGSVAIGGNGFVAAFVAGAAFGSAGRHSFAGATELTEDVGLFASFAVWLVFGAVFVGPVLAEGLRGWQVLYAVLSLTVVRMVPVALALLGSGLRRDTVAFVGWFGPRGLASVVFTLLAYEEIHGIGPTATLVGVTTWTILLSVLAHGLSAGPLAALYARRLSGAPAGLPELAESTGVHTRRRSLHDPSRRPRAAGPRAA